MCHLTPGRDDAIRRIARCTDPADPWLVVALLGYALILKMRADLSQPIVDLAARRTARQKWAERVLGTGTDGPAERSAPPFAVAFAGAGTLLWVLINTVKAATAHLA